MKKIESQTDSKLLTCPICASRSYLENHFDDIYLYRCQDCDHCFTDAASLKHTETYDEEYYEMKHRNWNQHPDLCFFERAGEIINAHKSNANVIDVGCGTGAFLRFLAVTYPDFTLTGIDVVPGRNLAGVETIKGDFLSTEFNRQFDVVVTLQVIEHFGDVSAFTERLHTITKKGGLIIVSTVNDRSISYAVARVSNAVGYKSAFERLYSRHHLQHFNTGSLRRLMERNNLVVKEVIRHNEPIASVDMPAVRSLLKVMLRVGVRTTFLVGRITGKTILQTIICQKC